MDWSDEMKYSLIDQVHENPMLWNILDINYMQPRFKQLVWDQIAQTMSELYDVAVTGTEAIRQWGLLRDAFNKNKKKPSSGSRSQTMPTWRFFERMRFLDSRPRKRAATDVKSIEVSDDSREKDDDECSAYGTAIGLDLREVKRKNVVVYLRLKKTIQDAIYQARMELANAV